MGNQDQKKIGVMSVMFDMNTGQIVGIKKPEQPTPNPRTPTAILMNAIMFIMDSFEYKEREVSRIIKPGLVVPKGK